MRLGQPSGPGVSGGGGLDGSREEASFPRWVLMSSVLSCFQEPDYGALYEGRNPGFYVEANPMPTFKVQPSALGTGSWGGSPAARGLHFSAQGRLWSLWRSGVCGFPRPERW